VDVKKKAGETFGTGSLKRTLKFDYSAGTWTRQLLMRLKFFHWILALNKLEYYLLIEYLLREGVYIVWVISVVALAYSAKNAPRVR